ncbi:hypothetical protein Vretimale_115, partial [Volvox reticuliferus]
TPTCIKNIKRYQITSALSSLCIRAIAQENMSNQKYGQIQSPTLMFFSSRSCPLCQRLTNDLRQINEKEKRLGILQVDAGDEARWAPELLHYKVTSVPAFILLDKQGQAVLSTSQPRSYEQMRQVLGSFVARATQH